MSGPVNIGAWRDRTNLFISYRQSYTHHPAKRIRFDTSSTGNGRLAPSADPDSESAGLLASNNDAVIEMDVLPPRWLDIQDEITQRLVDVSAHMKKLDQLHAKHVLPGFDDESVKAREEREIENLTQEVTRGFTLCQNAIRRIDKMVKEQKAQSGMAGISREDATMAKNLSISLATRVSEASTTFRKKQSAYLKKLRSLGGLSTPLDNASGGRGTPSSLAANPYTDPAMQDSELDRSSAQSTLLQTAQARRRTGMSDVQIEQREREIESIAQGVIDLSNIFQELQTMVIDQGSLLDRIDYNVERTRDDLKSAEKELKVATGYQKRTTKRRIMLLLVLVVVGMFILLLFKPKKNNGGEPSPAPTPPDAITPDPVGLDLPARSLAFGYATRDLETVAQVDWEWKHRKRRRDVVANVKIEYM